MATERYETVIAARYEGMGVAQNVVRDMRQVAEAMRMLEQLGSGTATPGSGVFSGFTSEDIGTKVREYDTLLRRMNDLRRAEVSMERVQRRLAIPEGEKGYVADPRVREEMMRGAMSRVDAAAERLAKALNADANQVIRDAERSARARQRALDDVNKAHYRRIQAEDAQLRAEEEAARQRSIAGQFAPTYAAPDLGTRTGVAQALVNKAERDLAIVSQRRAELLDRGNATATQILSADGMVEAATRRLAAARERLAAMETRQGLGQQFMAGFRGASDRPYAEQIGQAFKFSVFYGTAYRLLFGITQTLQQTLQEGIEFQNAMTELAIASGQSAEAAAEMAHNLGAQATAAGQAPSTGVLIGARSLGLFGATEAAGASAAEQERIATISARVVSRMALGSKTAPEELQTQIAAVANAFGGGAAGQIRAYDLDAYLGRQFGILQGMTVQAVAEAGTVGQAAGFDQEQVSAIAAFLQSRTGQTPSAVAGWMAQIFSRGGEGSLVSLTQRYGIDPNARLSTQIEELARVYKNASDTERAEIAAGFGRGKVQNAAVVLLEGLDQVMRVANEARTESRGEGDRISDLRLANIGGQIQLTVSTMQAFASELSRSGILEILGGALVVFRELTEATTGLLRAWASIPGPIRAAAVALGLLAVAARTSAAGGVIGALGRGGVAGVAAGTGARGALATAGPWIAATAGLYALGELANSSRALRAAQENATNLLNLGIEAGATPDDLRSRAAELQQGATMSREAAEGSWINDVVPAAREEARILQERASAMELEAARLERAAKVMETAAAKQAAGLGTPVITGFDPETLARDMDTITRSGGSAETRLRALNEAITGTGEAAAAAAPKFDPAVFAAETAGPLTTMLAQSISGLEGKLSEETVRRRLSGFGSSPEAQIRGALGGAGVTNLSKLDVQAATKVAQDLVARTEGTTSYVGTEEYNAAVEKVRDFLVSQARDARALVDTAIELTPDEGIYWVNLAVQEAANAAGNLASTDYGGAVRAQRGLVRTIQNIIGRTEGGATDEMVIQLNQARRALAQAQFAELEAMRRAAQRNAGSREEVARIGQRFLRREIRAAVRAGDQDLLAEIISQAGTGSIAIARNAIMQAMATAQSAVDVQRRIAAAAMSLMGPVGALGGLALQMAGKGDQLALLQSLQTALPAAGDQDVYTFGSDVPGYKAPEAADKKTKEEREAEREAARQEMLDLRNTLYLLSIDLSDPLAQATAAVRDARRRLRSDVASGQDRNTIAASRLALRQAQSEREATAFQQRLDAVTTAEELGRISHAKYINYLENERRRLNAVKNRTFQQQEQLDQIDRLLKDASASMEGMWNFGDIKLPTPYQVRRYIAAKTGDDINAVARTGGGSSVVDNSVVIHIDGADTGKVRKIVEETVSKAGRTLTTQARRR